MKIFLPSPLKETCPDLACYWSRLEPTEQREIFCFGQNQAPHFAMLLPTSALRFMVQRDLGLQCLCIGLAVCSTAQTTFWPLCRIFSDSDVCVMSFPISLKAARSCKIPHCLCFLLLWELLSQGVSVVLRVGVP